MTANTPFYKHWSFIYIVASMVSILLSTGLDFQEVVLNPDAICYLSSAEAIGQYGFTTAMHLCDQAKWPFYSAIIYGLVKITHFSYPLTAYLLDGVFSIFSVITFIVITKELGGSKRVQWLAAIVILLSHEFNSVREYIIRDHGFWAFYLLSILLLIRYFKLPQLKTGLAWGLSLMLATLFRIEGAIFLLALPFTTWFLSASFKQKAKCFFTLNLLTLGLALLVSIWMLIHPQTTLEHLGRVSEVTQQFQHGLAMIGERYHATESSLGQHVLTSDSAKQAGVVLFIVMIVWYLTSVFGNLSWVYSILVMYAWWRKAGAWTSSAALVLAGYLTVNVAVTLSFLFEHLFLSKRYLIALTLVLMLRVPFALDDLMQKWNSRKHRIFLGAAVFFIFISSLGGIFDFGYSKQYIRQAGDWLSTHVPATANLYSNDYQVMYYSHHFGNSIFEKVHHYSHIENIAHGEWKDFDYLALRIGYHEKVETAAIVAGITAPVVQEFSNERGDKVLIYKVAH